MKKLLSVLLSLSMILPLFVCFVAVSAEAPTGGVSFSENEMYYAESRLPDVPYTYEMWLYVPSDVKVHDGTNRLGTVMSNYANYSKRPYFHIDIVQNGDSYMLRYEYYTLTYNASASNLQKTEAGTWNFDAAAAKVTLGEWLHFAIVVDAQANAIKLYKNGELVQTKTNVKLPVVTLDERIKNLPVVVGNDNRVDQPYYFKGSISEVALYSDARTESEVRADYLGEPDKNDKNTLAVWDLSSAQGKSVKDAGPFGVDLIYSKEWLDPSEVSLPSDYAYSMIVVGDTQYMVEGDVNNGTANTKKLYKWIADNAPSLKTELVIGLGDVSDDGLDAEFALAHDAIKQMNGKVPYTVVRGNHDTYGVGNTAFNKYFANDSEYVAQFANGNGGFYEEGSVHNSYYKLTAGGTDWLVINIDWAAPASVIKWANDVIDDNYDRRVIVVTHQYMMQDGTTVDKLDINSGYSGADVWNDIVSKHDNIDLVLSGHVESNTIIMTQSEGKNGNTVTQFLIDGQDIDKDAITNKKGDPAALIAIFFFDKDGKTVDVRYYSPVRNKYYHGINQFSFDMESKDTTPSTPYNGIPVAPSGSGTEADPYIIKEAGNLYWMSEQIASSNTNVRYDAYTGAHLEDKYFKQICDIDLGGLFIRSIGYYSSTEYAGGSSPDKIDMAAFGGHYDGGGYKIKNGNIVPKLDKRGGHGANGLWGDGLFGCIYGATIKNVTLENVTVWCENIAGGIVGRAMAPTDGKAEGFNVISNCHLTEDCNIIVKHSYDANRATHAKNAYDTIYTKGFAGSIVGIASATTIENCSSAVEFEVIGYYSVTGGIVGAAGYNSVINNCTFTGGVTLKDNTSKIMSTFGGIVGLISPNAATKTLFSNDNMIGAIKITNCVNSGYFVYEGSAALTNAVNIGGIVGHAPTLANGKVAIVENCTNNYSFKAPNATGELYIGGIVGKGNTGSSYGPMTVKNCATVTVAAQGGSGNNAYRYDSTTSASGTSAIITEGVIHTVPSAYETDKDQHWQVCPDSGCDSEIPGSRQNHIWGADNKCTVCGFDGGECKHVGGNSSEATCKDQAVCAQCGKSYGPLDPDNHTGRTAFYTNPITHKHGRKFTCCGAVDTTYAERSHTLKNENGVCVCTVCDYKREGFYMNHVSDLYMDKTVNGQFFIGAFENATGNILSVEETPRTTWSATFPGNWVNGKNAYVTMLSDWNRTDKIVDNRIRFDLLPGVAYSGLVGFTAPGDGVFNVSALLRKIDSGKPDVIVMKKGESGCETLYTMRISSWGEEVSIDIPNIELKKGEQIIIVMGLGAHTTSSGTNVGFISFSVGAIYASCDHAWGDDSVCDNCGLTCQHEGGNATCNKLAVCDHCGKEYGSYDIHDHADKNGK